MSEDAFDGLLYQIIDTHREAERNRRMRRRMWPIMALAIGALMACGWYSQAHAQTAALPAYEGGGFAWDYPADAANHAGFKLTIDGVPGSTTLGKAVRQALFADTTLKVQPMGKTYTARLVATGSPPAKNSAPAVITFEYLARPQLVPPTNVRTILEWQP